MRMNLPIRILVLLLGLQLSSAARAADTAPKIGLRQNTPDAYALVGAKIIVAPGREIESGTVVIRDGKIAEVAPGEAVPAGVRRIDVRGRWIYPAFIESYTDQAVTADLPGPGYWNQHIVPQRTVASSLVPDDALNAEFRSQGFGARLVAPRDGIIKGQSALVLTSEGDISEAMLDDSVALHIRLTNPVGRRSGYPTSPMGAVALARQAFYDAQWYQAALAAVRADATLARPDANVALETLGRYVDAGGLVIADAPNELFVDRADRFAREFTLRLAIRGSGNEYRRLDEVRKTQRPVIVPLDFPKPPEVASPERAYSVSLEDLMHWHLAPENPGRLAEADVKIALTTDGLEKRGEFLAQLRKAIKRGLSRDDALRALTVNPAELLGVDGQLGSVEVGKIANLVVADGDLFDKGEVLTTWVNGKPYEIKSKPIASFVGEWKLTANEPVGKTKDWRLAITGKPERPAATIGLLDAPNEQNLKREVADSENSDEDVARSDNSGEDAVRSDDSERAVEKSSDEAKESSAETVKEEPGDEAEDAEQRDEDDDEKKSDDKQGADGPSDQKIASFKVAGYRITGIFPGKKFGADGKLTFTATLIQSGEEQKLSGIFRLPDGLEVPFTGVAEKQETKKTESNEQQDDTDEKAKDDSDAGNTEKPKKDADSSKLEFAVNYPLGAYGIEQTPPQENVALVNATVWTCADAGLLEGATVLIESGKIAAVAKDIELPEGIKTIDCTGRHITPGIIDCHSHAASDGGMNEMGDAITAEVRIADFVDPDDITIYRQLAGGVTAANLLHGSGNPIGGQSQVVKFRWGEGAEELKVHDAPAGIKFALGENVKRFSRRDSGGRYPQSRMGVDELMVDAFRAALAYRGEQRRWERDRTGLPPRRDLELDALLEILEHERWIHCHSYRQSEVLALLRTLELYNVRVGTLQHILEGYKVAPELAAHGAMSSCFSDWWAYKFEVYDAIPHNGSLMHQAGIVVSFNSDNMEMGRRLNQEAGKACKYGGTSCEDALKFVTLNVAKQLRIDHRVGSIEPGKDADVVVWSGEPISTLSRCEQTWIDGRLYFDLALDRKMRERDAQLRAQLIQEILADGDS
jgi:N-acetylglucosamine-6-phosphate deacetylase